MHENEYNGTGYIQPDPIVVCTSCKMLSNLKHIEPETAYWDGENTAYCERHGRLEPHQFTTIDV